MRQLVYFSISLWFFTAFSQEKKTNTSFDINYFAGTISLHNNDILHLIQGHPNGIIASWNKKTFGDKAWQQHYNYPDYGVSLIFQNLKYEKVLGNPFGVYAHYNFYFLKRNLMFRIAQGLAYTPHPYHKTKNPKNIAFGSHILSSTYALLQFKKERLFNRFGIQAGLALVHYSNANVKAPNTSVNSINFNLGLSYNIDTENTSYIKTITKEKYTEPIHFNFAFKTGINESDVVGSGQFPFYIFSTFIDKRLSYKSSVTFGTDVFFSLFLKEYIKYRHIAYPDEENATEEDYKRIGIFGGYQLHINKLSLLGQLGYYVYYPYPFEGRTYLRIGLKYTITKKWFTSITLKSHAAKAEAVEFGFGYRL